jgi:hypothetical protein
LKRRGDPFGGEPIGHLLAEAAGSGFVDLELRGPVALRSEAVDERRDGGRGSRVIDPAEEIDRRLPLPHIGRGSGPRELRHRLRRGQPGGPHFPRCRPHRRARIVEKHFTLDKNYSNVRDHQISADPAELKTLVSQIRAVERRMGTGKLEVRACELTSAQALRRSIAAGRQLEKGTLLKIGDLTWVRPGMGIPPGSESKILGRKLNKNKSLGESILEEDLSPA